MTIESVLHILLERLQLESPTQEELEAEFEIYKAELEAEQLRLDNLKSRYEALSDKGLIQGSLSISNPDVYFAELLQSSAEVAEEKMVEMEEAYQSLLSELTTPSKIEQIEALEKLITPRRYREAVLSGDYSFIESIEFLNCSSVYSLLSFIF